MKKLLSSSLILAILFTAAHNVLADGVLISWSMRDVPGLTEQAFNDAKQLTTEKILQKNLAVESWLDAFLITVAATAKKEDKQLLSGLVAQLTNSTPTKLKGAGRLIIWERITSGELLFEGKGYQVDDDLFTVGGRANWALRNVTKKNFGLVTPSSTTDDRAAIQKKWSRFLNGEQVEEYKNPFATTEKGLEEIRSLVALEGLIVSLKPTEAKNSLTKDCLQRLYKMDKLPSEGPARLCSPDTLTNGYLKILTGIEDQHDYDWWKNWWDKNRAKLEWSSKTARFELKGN